MSITSALVLLHLSSTAVLLTVLCLIISVQSLSTLASRLHLRWAPTRRQAAFVAPASAAAVARFSGVDRRGPLHSSS